MNINSQNLIPRPTDTVFDDSPDTGHPTCICSRCSQRIQEEEMAIRVWTKNEHGEMDEESKEYRYCELCMTGKKYFKCEKEGETFYRCDQQCEECKMDNPSWVK